jgi:cap1 methyltransferase
VDPIKIQELEKNIHQLQTHLNEIKNQLGQASEHYPEHWRHHKKKQRSPSAIFAQVRAFCNPMENICHSILHHHQGRNPNHAQKRFVCRSALKLANIDALLDYQLVSVNTDTRATLNRPFIFVDLCGAPGGFTEYILYRIARNHHNKLDPCVCQGFGTLFRIREISVCFV